MVRATLEANLDRVEEPYQITDRFVQKPVALTQGDYDNLCRMHLCDWLEQAVRAKRWDYRCDAFRRMATRLGGVAEMAHQRVYAQAPKTEANN